MKCSKCNSPAIFSEPNYCEKHFLNYFEKKVENTIKKFNLLDKKEKIVVATSGGKDSLTTIYILKKLGYKIKALAIDEGIRGYRKHTLEDLKKFCRQNEIKFKIISFKKEFNKTLDLIIKKHPELNPCTVCGTFRRFLLNKYSREYDKLVTGHNLDDECQAVLMNIIKNQNSINARLGPFSGLIKDKKFTPRVKPLYFCTEKEVVTYAYLKKFISKFTECPYEDQSYRSKIRDFINDIEMIKPGFKHNVILNYINILPKIKKRYATTELVRYCEKCKEPSKKELCKKCELLRYIS